MMLRPRAIVVSKHCQQEQKTQMIIQNGQLNGLILATGFDFQNGKEHI